jgi:hypothetical protein
MARINFIKLCPIGKKLFEDQDFLGRGIPMSERFELFEEMGSYNIPEENLYQEHIRKCPICKYVVESVE